MKTCICCGCILREDKEEVLSQVELEDYLKRLEMEE